ncbi:MAG: RHS repeat domain-containing protein, partial [Pyrinomonadaceae bacterium]
EYNGSTGAIQKEYIYGASGLLATVESGLTQYLTTDHLGSPRIATDGSGTVTSRRDFMPFGEEVSTGAGRSSGAGWGGTTVRQKFTGYERDDESGLDFAQARTHSFSLGRFSSPDPYNIVLEVQAQKDPEKSRALLLGYIEKTQQWNRYVYVVNNPLMYIDPSGEVLKLTGSADSNEKFYNLLKEMLGEKAAANLTYEVTDQGEWIIDYKGPGGLDIGGEFGVALQDIIDSSKIVSMRMTTDHIRDHAGSVTDMSPNLRDISIRISYDGVHSAEKALEKRNLKFTLSVLMAHELGHAWGAILDRTVEQTINLRFYQSGDKIRLQNYKRAVRLEDIERRRLGLSLRKYH